MKTGRRFQVVIIVVILSVFSLIAHRSYQHLQDKQHIRNIRASCDVPENPKPSTPMSGDCPRCGTLITVTMRDFSGYWDGTGLRGPISGRFCTYKCQKCSSSLVSHRVHGDISTNVSWNLIDY